MRGPDASKRTVVIGRTGTGKTVAALNLLAGQAIHKMPWVVIDYKGEEMLDDIQRTCRNVQWIRPRDAAPKRPGLYRMTPDPTSDDGDVEEMLRRIYHRENVGVYIDEGFAMPKSGKTPGFERLLTQGRSKRIPMIINYQRPFWMTKFAITQADFFYLFPMNDDDDRKMIKKQTVPAKGQGPLAGKLIDLDVLSDRLPPHYGLWYDVGRNTSELVSPCPPPKVVIEKFQARLGRR